MALSDVIKKREVTNEGKKEKKSGISNILDDVRIVIAVIVLASIALIGLIVYNNGKIEKTREEIKSVRSEIVENQNKIANLKALQARSGEYLAQKEAYDEMISDEELDQLEIMIDLEKDVEQHGCNLSEISFDDITATGMLNQMKVTVRINGDFRSIMSFCRDTVSGVKIRRIDNIRMTGDAMSSQKTAEITIVYFSR